MIDDLLCTAKRGPLSRLLSRSQVAPSVLPLMATSALRALADSYMAVFSRSSGRRCRLLVNTIGTNAASSLDRPTKQQDSGLNYVGSMR